MSDIDRTWSHKTVNELRRQDQPVPEWLADIALADMQERLDALKNLAAGIYAEVALICSDIVEWIDPLTGVPNRHAIRGWQRLSHRQLIVEVTVEDGTRHALFGQIEDASGGVLFLNVADVRFIAAPSDEFLTPGDHKGICQ